MQRLTFIKNLGLGATGMLLPNPFVESKPVKVYDNYVRGLTHYDFEEIQKSIKEGDQLTLVREPQNLYDNFAIQVNCGEHRLGYIAAYENIVLANMLDAGVNLTAFVSKIDSKHSVYEALALEIFADLIIATPQLIKSLQSEKRADDAQDIYREI